MPYLPILLFALLYAVAALSWGVPHAAALHYTVASVVCFAMYAADKSAAREKTRRTPESTLLLLGLVGGWPGAVLAQQWLRHKTAKQPFRARFWASVVVNTGVFAYLVAPQSVLRQLG